MTKLIHPLYAYSMQKDDQFLLQELRRLEADCRLQARSRKPQLALMRIASSLNSLALSLSQEPTGNSPLSKREMEILGHVSQGYTNREIASALYLSEKTIEFHLKSIFRKTDADTRTEAVKNAMLNNWI